MVLIFRAKAHLVFASGFPDLKFGVNVKISNSNIFCNELRLLFNSN